MALQLNLVGDPEADALLAEDPLALLIGMLLDQQVPMETAFLGPKKLADRLSGIDVRRIADMDTDEFIAVCAEPPAVHRFPKSMGERIQLMCQFIVENYDGDDAGGRLVGHAGLVVLGVALPERVT
ncbi:HhH-GPD-type base excision DNA repair protein, partial [Streptomyces sp. NPDC013313]|uniref:HhH-GPD-type base excision DNA repair protein n=1 Tax=Streptomyces sp. NPDC013313 TaxID=3155603 RepID=UPI0033C07A18